MAQMVSEKMIKVRSQELGIPYANMACACVIEDALIRIAKSKYARQLWLQNISQLGLERYRHKKVNTLDFCYENEESCEVQTMMESLFCCKDNISSIQWSWKMDEMADPQPIMIASMWARIGVMEIPLTIRFYSANLKRMEPQIQEYRLCMQNNEHIQLSRYPWEYVVASSFAQIMEKMELLNELRCYYEIHVIIHRQPLDARLVQEQLVTLCALHHVSIDEKRMKMLLGYRDYSYMVKRWKRFLKAEKMTSPDWDEVMSDIEHFFAPIWKMILKDMIFIADWMPELQRYLD